MAVLWPSCGFPSYFWSNRSCAGGERIPPLDDAGGIDPRAPDRTACRGAVRGEWHLPRRIGDMWLRCADVRDLQCALDVGGRAVEGRGCSAFTLASLVAVAPMLKVGLDLLREREGVRVDGLVGHGGLFKLQDMMESVMSDMPDIRHVRRARELHGYHAHNRSSSHTKLTVLDMKYFRSGVRSRRSSRRTPSTVLRERTVARERHYRQLADRSHDVAEGV